MRVRAIGMLALAGCSIAHEPDEGGVAVRDTSADSAHDAAATVRDTNVDATRRDGATDASRGADGGFDAGGPCGEPRIVGSVAVPSLAVELAADRGFVYAVGTRSGCS